MKHILLCPSCKKYTMLPFCDKCQIKTLSPRPPKYSPIDKYAKYRRIATENERKKEGLI